MKPNTQTMMFGSVIFVATVAAWLWGESHAIDTTIIWSVATPLVLALFVGQGLADTAAHAQQAAQQTNGQLDGRMKAAMAAALADRYAARTRQAVLGEVVPQPVEVPATGSRVAG